MVLASWKIICNRDWKEVGACTDGRSIKVVERKSVLASMETQLRPVGEKKWCLHHGNSTTKFVVGHEGCLHLFVSENEPVVNEAVACNCGMNCTVVNEVVACNCGMNYAVGERKMACHGPIQRYWWKRKSLGGSGFTGNRGVFLACRGDQPNGFEGWNLGCYNRAVKTSPSPGGVEASSNIRDWKQWSLVAVVEGD